MFGATILLFLFIKIIGGHPQLPGSEFEKFGRDPPSYKHQLRQDDPDQLPLMDQQEGGDMQQLAHQEDKHFDNEGHVSGDEDDLGPDGPAFSGKPQKGKNRGKGEAAPQNVNRVQELTAELWPMGIVPYFVDKQVYDATTTKRIVKAMSVIESVSCVIFKEMEQKPAGSQDGWLHITNPKQERECVHEFVVADSGIEIVLGFDCLRPEEILHSLLHALGFRDEVAHPQRDFYIRVLWNNIQPKYRKLFRLQHEDASYQLLEYDPMSIMHFHDRAFSDNGAATIAALIPGLQFVPTTTLSQLDILRIKLAFSHECNKRNIGNLITTCKKSLKPHSNKIEQNQGGSANAGTKGDNQQDKEIDSDPVEGGAEDAIEGEIIIDDDDDEGNDNKEPQEIDNKPEYDKIHHDEDVKEYSKPEQIESLGEDAIQGEIIIDDDDDDAGREIATEDKSSNHKPVKLNTKYSP